MAEPIRTIEAEALKLNEKDRAKLARILLLSLDDSGDQDTALAWAEEAEWRYRELRSGAMQGIPADQVLEEARARLR